jgi:cobalt/nickel transport system permease protein
MHAHPFDPFLPSSSVIHKLDPRIKLLLTLAFILGVAIAPLRSWAALILLYATILSIAIMANIGVVRVIRRSAVALPFMLAALPLLFRSEGTPLLTFYPWPFVITTEGILQFLALAAKSWISVQAAILLSATTPFPDLLLAMRFLHIPKILVSVIGLMWRYLFLLADEAIRMIHARDARSGVAPGQSAGGSLLWRAQVTGGMAGSLLIRGLDRADRVYSAMLARGYDGETRSMPVPPLASTDYRILAAGVGWIMCMWIFGTFFR